MTDDKKTTFKSFDELDEIFKTLDDGSHLERRVTAVAPVEQRNVCLECTGTGRWKGTQKPCYACKGKGYYVGSPKPKKVAGGPSRGQQKALTKAERLQEKREAFKAAHPALVERLNEVAPWHKFARAMVEALNLWGSLTEKQLAAAIASMQRLDAREADRAANQGDVDMGALEKMFDAANANGLQRPQFRVAGLVISRAPVTGRNAGALYVKSDGQYAGKIMEGTYYPISGAPAGIIDKLREIAADPLGSAVKYGRATGHCSCCSRPLSDPTSVKLGIGPICKQRWGL